MTPVSWILLALFWFLLAAAAISDLRTLRISNLLSLLTLISALAILLVVRDDAGAWWEHVASFAIMLAVGFGLFSLGWIGGGDAKFAAGPAVLFTLGELVWYVVGITFAGALLTIILLVFRRTRTSANSGWKGLAKGRSIPYGVAIALGAAAASVPILFGLPI